jgi:hypothetical protein
MTKMEKQPNKRNKYKKTYREIAMEKQANTCKIEKQSKKKQGKQTMSVEIMNMRNIQAKE